jgi:hypothetical protein
MRPVGAALTILLALVFLVGGSGWAASSKPTPKASKQAKKKATGDAPGIVAIEPKAVELLKAACARLAAAQAMSFTATLSYESPSRLGPPLVYTTKSEVLMKRPDRLRVITPGDGPASEFFYDGKKMTAFAPAEKLAAVAEAPATIDAALKAAYDKAAIYFPFSDLVVADPFKGLAEDMKLAFYIGQSKMVGGTVTDMVAYADDGMFAQIWIGAEDKLPRRVRVIYLNDPSRLRHQMDLSDWQLDPVVPEDAFVATGAAGANPMAFARPDPQAPPGIKPPVKIKAFKPQSK